MGSKELDTTEQLSFYTYIYIYILYETYRDINEIVKCFLISLINLDILSYLNCLYEIH